MSENTNKETGQLQNKGKSKADYHKALCILLMLTDLQKHAQMHPSRNERICPSRKCLINLVQRVESQSAKVENSLLVSKIYCIVLERTFQIKVEMMSENQRYETDV